LQCKVVCFHGPAAEVSSEFVSPEQSLSMASDQTGLDSRHELCHCVKKKFALHMVDGMRLIYPATLCFPCYVRCLGLFGESGPHQLRYETSAIRGFVVFPSASDLHRSSDHYRLRRIPLCSVPVEIAEDARLLGCLSLMKTIQGLQSALYWRDCLSHKRLDLGSGCNEPQR